MVTYDTTFCYRTSGTEVIDRNVIVYLTIFSYISCKLFDISFRSCSNIIITTCCIFLVNFSYSRN